MDKYHYESFLTQNKVLDYTANNYRQACCWVVANGKIDQARIAAFREAIKQEARFNVTQDILDKSIKQSRVVDGGCPKYISYLIYEFVGFMDVKIYFNYKLTIDYSTLRFVYVLFQDYIHQIRLNTPGHTGELQRSQAFNTLQQTLAVRHPIIVSGEREPEPEYTENTCCTRVCS